MSTAAFVAKKSPETIPRVENLSPPISPGRSTKPNVLSPRRARALISEANSRSKSAPQFSVSPSDPPPLQLPSNAVLPQALDESALQDLPILEPVILPPPDMEIIGSPRIG